MSNPSPVESPPLAVFAALGDPTRMEMLTRLSDGETRSIAALCSHSTLTRQAVTKHLRVLESAGLVRRIRVGRESRFAYRPAPVDEARAWLDVVSRRWDAALGRLRALVED
jgi:DNA-binding transcriptional ArsR family regulator